MMLFLCENLILKRQNFGLLDHGKCHTNSKLASRIPLYSLLVTGGAKIFTLFETDVNIELVVSSVLFSSSKNEGSRFNDDSSFDAFSDNKGSSKKVSFSVSFLS